MSEKAKIEIVEAVEVDAGTISVQAKTIEEAEVKARVILSGPEGDKLTNAILEAAYSHCIKYGLTPKWLPPSQRNK